VKVQQKALELAQRLLAENKKRVEVGAMAPLDEKSAESQAAISRAGLLAAQQALAAQQNTLKSLIIDDYSNWHDVQIQPAEKLTPQPAVLDLQASWQLGLTQRPDLLQSRVAVERQNIVLRYSRNQLFPELDLTGTYGYLGSGKEFSGALGQIGNGDNNFYSVGVQLTIPLSNRQARESHKLNKAQKEQLLLQLKQLEQNILVQIDNAVKAAQTSYDQLDATRQAREFAQAALEAEQKKLENGKSTSYQVLLLQRDLTQRSSDEIQALAQYNKALATLSQAEGTTLEKNNLTVEVRE
jgi:outer membrane protein